MLSAIRRVRLVLLMQREFFFFNTPTPFPGRLVGGSSPAIFIVLGMED